MPVLIAKDKIEEIKRLIEDGLSQREVEQITGINRGTISRIAARGFTVGSPGGRKKGGEIAMSIDKHDIDAYKAEPGKRLDGTPDLDYSPAFADDGDEVPFAELEPIRANEEAKSAEHEETAAIKQSTVRRSVKLQGDFCAASIDGNGVAFNTDAIDEFNTASETIARIDEIIEELKTIRAAIYIEASGTK